jgi:hypothetical protein
MDLQAVDQTKGKRGLTSKLTVSFCLLLTAALLIGSLVSPRRASTKAPHEGPTASVAQTPD